MDKLELTFPVLFGVLTGFFIYITYLMNFWAAGTMSLAGGISYYHPEYALWETPDFEVCEKATMNFFLYNITNWDAVKVSTDAVPIHPIFEEVGPYNASRNVCKFNFDYIEADQAQHNLAYYEDWEIVSDIVDVSEPVIGINAAYFLAMEGLGKEIGSRGVGAEDALKVNAMGGMFAETNASIPANFRGMVTDTSGASNAALTLTDDQIVGLANSSTAIFANLPGFLGANNSFIQSEWGLNTAQADGLRTFFGDFLQNAVPGFLELVMGGVIIPGATSGPIIRATPHELMYNHTDSLLIIIGSDPNGPPPIKALNGKFAISDPGPGNPPGSQASTRAQAQAEGLTEKLNVYIPEDQVTFELYNNERIQFKRYWDRKTQQWLEEIPSWDPPVKVSGMTEVGLFPVNLEFTPEGEPIEVDVWFANGIDRPITFEKTGSAPLKDEEFYVMTMKESEWDSSSQFHQSIPGLFNVSAPHGAPFELYVSRPGMYNVGDAVNKSGIPTAGSNTNLWKFFAHPRLGTTFVVELFIQLNIFCPGFFRIPNNHLPEGYYPIFWENVHVDVTFLMDEPNVPNILIFLNNAVVPRNMLYGVYPLVLSFSVFVYMMRDVIAAYV